MIDVNIADDHTMLAESLAEAINRKENIRVSRLFTSIEACRQTFEERRPDILLLDVSMPDGNGIELCREIIAKYPKIKVIAVTIHDEYSVIRRMLDCGIHGYVLKSSSVEQLVEAIERVWRGERFISPEVETIIAKAENSSVILSEVERNILQLICSGMTNPQIAQQLCLSTETVNWYRKRLLAKFGVKNTVGLVTLVMREHLLM